MDTDELFDLLDWIGTCDKEAADDGSDLWTVAGRIVRSDMPNQRVLDAATDWLVTGVRELRRGRTHRAEQAAQAAAAQEQAKVDRAARAERRAQREEEKEREFAERMNFTARILNDYKAAVRMEWEQELLDSGFSLPDGTVVTWGDATVEQHQQRADMFTKHADADLQGAARHLHAIDTLTDSGATTLREYVNRMEQP